MNSINTKLWLIIVVLTPLSCTSISSTVWADTIQCAEVASCYGSADNDVMTGTVFIEEIFALAGNDYVYAFGGADRVNGDAGHDYIDAGPGLDVVDGGSEDDSIVGDAGNDRLEGNL
jgi:Ca2+-binding RTX toxin-like protein